MADYNSKYSGEQIEQLLQQAGGGSTVTEQTVSGWGFTKNQGTVTGVKINGSTKNPSNGVVDLGTVITSHQDISGKQDKLVSGTNIKTINNQSILGSGNITISGGGSSDKVEGVGIYPVVNGNEWTYQIPAGKFVELVPVDSTTGPSYIHFELLDPVEITLGSGDDLTAEYSKYHFLLTGLSVNSPFGFGTNTNPNATPCFFHNVTSATYPPPCVEFDVLCSLIHPPASTGYPDQLYGYITMAPLYNS